MVMREAFEEGIFLLAEHMTMTGRRLELRPEWKRLAFKEMDSEAMVFMTLLPYKGGKGGRRDLFCKLRA